MYKKKGWDQKDNLESIMFFDITRLGTISFDDNADAAGYLLQHFLILFDLFRVSAYLYARLSTTGS